MVGVFDSMAAVFILIAGDFNNRVIQSHDRSVSLCGSCVRQKTAFNSMAAVFNWMAAAFDSMAWSFDSGGVR